MTWRRLSVLIEHLPAQSATGRAMHGDDADWTLTDYLLAGSFDALQIANWQRAGDRKAPRPRPFPRPGVKPDDRLGDTSKLDQDEVRRRLALRAPTREEVGTDGG